MAEVSINSIEAEVNIVDADVLLTPEMLDKVAMALRQRMAMEQTQQREAEDDRQLREGASR